MGWGGVVKVGVERLLGGGWWVATMSVPVLLWTPASLCVRNAGVCSRAMEPTEACMGRCPCASPTVPNLKSGALLLQGLVVPVRVHLDVQAEAWVTPLLLHLTHVTSQKVNLPCTGADLAVMGFVTTRLLPRTRAATV